MRTNYEALVRQLLPPFQRTGRQVAWLGALLQPVKRLQQEFLEWKAERQIPSWGQVLALQQWLNAHYDPDLQRIRLADGDFANTDFLVKLPQSLFDDAATKSRLEAQAAAQKPAGKRFATVAIND